MYEPSLATEMGSELQQKTISMTPRDSDHEIIEKRNESICYCFVTWGYQIEDEADTPKTPEAVSEQQRNEVKTLKHITLNLKILNFLSNMSKYLPRLFKQVWGEFIITCEDKHLITTHKCIILYFMLYL